MSTRSRIGIQLEDGSILSVYHHNNGEPEWLGVRLKKKYNTQKKIMNLLKKGNISSIESYRDWRNDRIEKPKVLYFKDRGDQNMEAIQLYLCDLINNCKDSNIDYLYVFNNEFGWKCFEFAQVTVVNNIEI